MPLQFLLKILLIKICLGNLTFRPSSISLTFQFIIHLTNNVLGLCPAASKNYHDVSNAIISNCYLWLFNFLLPLPPWTAHRFARHLITSWLLPLQVLLHPQFQILGNRRQFLKLCKNLLHILFLIFGNYTILCYVQ